MSFFDCNPMFMPSDAQYYFDVCVIHVAVRGSLGGEFEDIWDLSKVLEPRPLVLHIFVDEEDTFEDDRKWDIEVAHHCIVEVSESLGICYYSSDISDEAFDEGTQYTDPNDLWRF